MLNLLKRLVREEEGQGMIEYALIAGLISVIAIALVVVVGGDVQALWQRVVNGTEPSQLTPSATPST